MRWLVSKDALVTAAETLGDKHILAAQKLGDKLAAGGVAAAEKLGNRLIVVAALLSTGWVLAWEFAYHDLREVKNVLYETADEMARFTMRSVKLILKGALYTLLGVILLILVLLFHAKEDHMSEVAGCDAPIPQLGEASASPAPCLP